MGNGQEAANTSRGRRIFPRLESTQSVDGSARNARNATLFVRYLARASPLRSLRGSCLQMYSCVPWLSGPPPPLLLPPLAPFELRRSSNRHATIVARENVLVSRYRIYSHHSPPPVYILPRKGHEIPGLFPYGRIAN